jgi:Mg2+ and Co2+ transporter CorA
LESSLAEHSNAVQQDLLLPLLRDFKRFSRQIKLLKSDCDQFLEQQISKLALQDARAQIQEAKDRKQLSYFAFFFVPLSLASSFFGMNVKELDSGSKPVWVFVVVALDLLGISLLITLLTSRWNTRTALSSIVLKEPVEEGTNLSSLPAPYGPKTSARTFIPSASRKWPAH